MYTNYKEKIRKTLHRVSSRGKLILNTLNTLDFL